MKNNSSIIKNPIHIAGLYIPNTYNYGSMMMAENFITYLYSMNSGIRLYLDLSTDLDLQRMVESTGRPILRLKEAAELMDNDSRGKGKMAKKIIRLTDVYQRPKDLEKQSISSIVVFGGDSISEYYTSPFETSIDLLKIAAFASKMKIFLVSQTVGPFHSWRIPIAKKALSHPNLHIYTRDPLNYCYLKEKLGLTNVMDCRDLAFLPLSKQAEKDNRMILDRYDLQKDQYVTVVPSGLWKHYHDDRKEYISSWQSVCERLVVMGYNVVLLPHVLQPEHVDDRIIIQEIASSVSTKKVLPIYDEMLPYEARYILGNGLLTVTGRMHAAVSTFQMGKPAISLSYSIKYAGVIGRGLGRNDLILDATDKALHGKGILSNAVEEKVMYVLDNYKKLIDEIGSSVEECKQKAMVQITDVATKIGECS